MNQVACENLSSKWALPTELQISCPYCRQFLSNGCFPRIDRYLTCVAGEQLSDEIAAAVAPVQYLGFLIGPIPDPISVWRTLVVHRFGQYAPSWWEIRNPKYSQHQGRQELFEKA